MRTAFSDPDYIRRVARMQVQAMQVNPPAIPFRRERTTEDEAKYETKKIKIKVDVTDEDSDELEVCATVFDEGDAEDWIRWRIQLDELIRDKNLTTGRQKSILAKALLKGEAREKFTNLLINLELAEGENDDEEDDDERFDAVIERLGLDYFATQNAYRRQRNYLRYHLFMMDMSLSDFRTELRRQNQFLRYFPVPDGRESSDMIPDDELVDIVDRAKRIEWQRDLLVANIDPYSLTLDEYYRYLEKLKVKHALDKSLKEASKRRGDPSDVETTKPRAKKKSKTDHKPSKMSKAPQKRDAACKHCDKWHQLPDDKCWSLEKNKLCIAFRYDA